MSTAKTIFKSLCSTYEGNQQVKKAKENILVQHYKLFKMKDAEDIETMFFRFQTLVSGLQILSKSYTTIDHIKKILRSLPAKFRPKVTTIQEAKNLNKLSLESLIRNLHIHEMELNGDEPVMKSKTLALEFMARISGCKTVRSSNIWKSEEVLMKKLLLSTMMKRK